jgi:cytochrome d ubiquinol oxidase subunit II
MATLWFILLGFMLITYVLLDGFDLGAGVLHLVGARSDAERRIILRAIGPVWDGNEVWLIAVGATLLFTFPLLYASSFSGFYLPLFIVLWLLILRGIAIELRNHVGNPVWMSFWDGTFFVGSSLLAFFYGVAAANVIRGVALDTHGTFFAPLWTDFDPRSATPGILDWYTVLIGLLSLAALTAHGSLYIAFKTEGEIAGNARRVGLWAWLATIVLTIVGTLATFAVQPAMAAGFAARPWGVVFSLIALAGLAGMGYFSRLQRDLPAFIGSAAFLFGMLASAAVGLYPKMLPAVNPANSLTIYNAAASTYAQTVGLIWWTIGMILAVGYFVFMYRHFGGKVRVEQGDAGY